MLCHGDTFYREEALISKVKSCGEGDVIKPVVTATPEFELLIINEPGFVPPSKTGAAEESHR